MDLSPTTEPRSDQQNFDDYIAGPKTVTIAKVTPGTTEQPVEVHLVEFPGRPYKPSKSMRRVLIAAWGSDASVYAGRRMTLAGDPTVKFGGVTVGGIKIAALSDLDAPLKVQLTVTRGKRAPHTVTPLTDAPQTTEPTAEEIAACTSVDDLRAMWNAAGPERQAQIKARVEELQATDTTVPDDAPGQLFEGGGER